MNAEMLKYVLALTFMSTICLFVANAASPYHKPPPSLVAAFAVIRHGDRSPSSFYPNDPFQNESYWPEGIGQMNQIGIERMSAAGELYLQRYRRFLLATNGWPIYAKSSILKRNILSAELFMESFLAKDKPDVNVTEMIQLDQLMLKTDYPCKKADAAWLEEITSQEVIDYIERNRAGIERLERLTGGQYLSNAPYILRNLTFLATCLEIERDQYKLDVPGWAQEAENIDLLTDIKKYDYIVDWRSPVVQRFRAGPLLGDIAANIARLIAGQTNQRFYLYSSHDVNQAVLLQTLKAYDQMGAYPPTLSSAIVFEVYKSTTGNYYIRLLYRQVNPKTRTSSVNNPPEYKLFDTPLSITDCNDQLKWNFGSPTNQAHVVESFCSFEQFQQLIRDKVPADYELECGNL